jgi:hypothetical protein
MDRYHRSVPDVPPTVLENKEPSEAAEDGDVELADHAELLDSGLCPWCGGEYDNARSHAAPAHPEEWAAFKESEE